MPLQKLFRLPQEILRARRSRGVAQKALAEAVGVGGSRLSAIEKGRAIGTANDMVERLSSALKLSDAERVSLKRAAAQDRAMREITKDYSPDDQELVAACLDAARLLAKEDRDALKAFVLDLVGPRERFATYTKKREEPMN